MPLNYPNIVRPILGNRFQTKNKQHNRNQKSDEKHKSIPRRRGRRTLALSNCSTTYTASGRPVQSVSPEGAVVGALAAGLTGYAIGNNNNYNNYNKRRNYKTRYNNGRGKSKNKNYYRNRRR